MKTFKSLCLCVVVSFVLLCAFSVSALEEEQVVVKLTGLEGKVLVKIQPSSEWVDAEVGMLLKKNDSIKTLADGKAHLKLNEMTGFLVQPNSEILLEMPLVIEPYEEAIPDRDPVYAPNHLPQEPASRV